MINVEQAAKNLADMRVSLREAEEALERAKREEEKKGESLTWILKRGGDVDFNNGCWLERCGDVLTLSTVGDSIFLPQGEDAIKLAALILWNEMSEEERSAWFIHSKYVDSDYLNDIVRTIKGLASRWLKGLEKS